MAQASTFASIATVTRFIVTAVIRETTFGVTSLMMLSPSFVADSTDHSNPTRPSCLLLNGGL